MDFFDFQNIELCSVLLNSVFQNYEFLYFANIKYLFPLSVLHNENFLDFNKILWIFHPDLLDSYSEKLGSMQHNYFYNVVYFSLLNIIYSLIYHTYSTEKLKCLQSIYLCYLLIYYIYLCIENICL